MTSIDGSLESDAVSLELHGTRKTVAETVQQRLLACPYSYCFSRVRWKYAHGTLTLEGSVATFYLKQVLQSVLGSMEKVDRIANDVDVVSSTGLSSERDNERTCLPGQFGVPLWADGPGRNLCEAIDRSSRT
jgi:hypothetical protein